MAWLAFGYAGSGGVRAGIGVQRGISGNSGVHNSLDPAAAAGLRAWGLGQPPRRAAGAAGDYPGGLYDGPGCAGSDSFQTISRAPQGKA